MFSKRIVMEPSSSLCLCGQCFAARFFGINARLCFFVVHHLRSAGLRADLRLGVGIKVQAERAEDAKGRGEKAEFQNTAKLVPVFDQKMRQ
jgi:hypothetical protein